MVEALISIGWADGRFVAQEHEFIDAALASMDASEKDGHLLRAYAATPHTLDEIPLDQLDAADGERLLDLAVVLSWIDGEQADRERERIDELASRLGIPAQSAEATIATAGQRANRLLELL